MKTSKVVYFVRHGESKANRENVFQAPDDAVTARGHAQNASVAERFKGIDFDVLVASPFERASATARAIAESSNVTFEIDERWREYVPPTSLLGKQRASVEGLAYMQARKEHLHRPEWRYEDEENYFDLHSRAEEALNSLQNRSERTIVVVTHLGFMKAVLTHMLLHGKAHPSTYANVRFLFEAKNTGITICRYGSDKKDRYGWRMLTWNDYSHLPPALSEHSDVFSIV
jgi:broad specificity phosphatase PhoE